jgi:hypothetical protein
MSPTITNSFLTTMTTQGMLDAWSNAWGITAPLPDSAALILQPTNLLSLPLLQALTLADLTIDPNSVVATAGLITVELYADTGLAVASATIQLPVSPNTTPVGIALYNHYSSDLWAVSIFSQFPSASFSPITWNFSIPLGQCLSG